MMRLPCLLGKAADFGDVRDKIIVHPPPRRALQCYAADSQPEPASLTGRNAENFRSRQISSSREFEAQDGAFGNDLSLSCPVQCPI